MSWLTDMQGAANRLLTYYNGDEKTALNPGGMTGPDGMAQNWDPCIRDIGTGFKGVGEALTSIATSESNTAGSAAAAAGSAIGAAGSAAAAHADRLAADADAVATAADRIAVASDRTVVHADRVAADAAAVATAADRVAVASDKTAVHNDRLAADVDAAATAADRIAVAADKATVATDRAATHADRLAADTAAASAVASAAGLNLPALTAGDAGKTLIVNVGGMGYALGYGGILSAGSIAAPGLSVVGDADTGLAQIGGANTLSVVGGAQELVRYTQQLMTLNPGRAAINPKLLLQGPSETEDYAIQRDPATGCLIVNGIQAGFSAFSFRVNNGTERLRIPNSGPLLVDGVALGSGEDTAASIAAASTVDIGGATARAITVTAGTGPITAWGTAPAGAHRDVTFATAVQLTHNAASAILTGAGHITTMVGDTCRMESLGAGNWRMLSYQRANGVPLGVLSTQALSPSDKSSNVALSNSNMTVTTSNGSLASGRAVAAIATPQYWEVTVNAIGANVVPGLASAAVPLTDYISNHPTGYGYLPGGMKANNSAASTFGAAYAAGDRLCFAYHPTSRGFFMGKVVGGAAVWGGGGDPATGANPAFVIPAGTAVYPAYSLNGAGASLTFALGAGQQAATPPTGFFAFV